MDKNMTLYKKIFLNRNYCKIMLANFVNRFGDSIDAIAFTWLVYQVTGQAVWSAIIFGFNMLPSVILQPFAGVLVEKMKKKNIMILCDIVRGFLVALVAILFLAKLLSPWLLLTITIINSSFEAIRVPAGIAIVPQLIEKDLFEVGTSLNSSISKMVELIGMGLAGVIIAFFGIHTTILIDTATFLISALILSFLKHEEKIQDSEINAKTYWKSFRDGFSYIKNKEIIMLLCVLGALINMALTPFNAFEAVYARDYIKGGSEVLSIFGICLSIGMIVGSTIYPWISKYMLKKYQMILSFLSVGILYAVMAFITKLPLHLFGKLTVIGFAAIILGFGVSLTSNCVSVLMMTIVNQNYIARVSSVFVACLCSVIPIMSFLLSAISTLISVPLIFLFFGILLVGISIMLIFIKPMAKLDAK